MKNKLLLFAFLMFSFLSLTAQVKSPSEFLEYELGSQFSRHADVVNYFEHIAENSPLVTYHTYGKTNERRPLTYAVISSEENLSNIEDIRKNHLKQTGILDGDPTTDKAIVWLSYNVHGNEASSTEAAMKTLYNLITEKQDWLKNTIVIIDPCVNPDGRDRYANWYNQVRQTPFSTSQDAAEHYEPWPGGRPNHYLYDLNRDWVWATQVETRSRLKIYNQWMPHIHVDFHEQGINNPYYFAPAAEPFHDIITPFQRDFQTRIGKNNAKYFDEEGWLFFTKESFDLLYPSYGDTYPTYMGAIGMTYEQAGHGRGGLGIETDQEHTLTLKDRIDHHFTTGISTIEMASKNAEELASEFSNYFKNTDRKYETFALNGNKDKIDALKELLDRHKIKYSTANSGEKISGYSFTKNENGSLTTTDQTLLVSTQQPKGHMVEVLFEPKTKLNDSVTYDITAWSLPYAYGLDAVASSKSYSGKGEAEKSKVKNTINAEGAGYIANWKSIKDAEFLAALLKQEVKVRFSELPFSSEGKKFNAGTLVITKSDNKNLENFNDIVVETANEFERELTVANTSFVSSGPDFGSPDMKLIGNPNIAVLRGEGTSSLNYGEIWYFFEQELHFPITALGTDYLNRIDLSSYDILIVPEGYYGSTLGETALKKIKDFVSAGGKMITIGRAVGNFAGKDGFSIKENRVEENKEDTNTPNLTPYSMRQRESIKNNSPGSIVKTTVDNTHPLAFGYDKTYFSLKLSSSNYGLLSNGYNVAYMQEPQVVSGFVGSEAYKTLENSVVFAEENMGRGSVIYMVDNPLFRSFWQNGKLFFANALFMVK
ncbi:M14 family metallopeptidase [Zunongwangia sp. HRR-M8]|uniref:M14 family metallopeptidase n=1 Tax=Zunongwangia sp. HRR-M8 TaxID=3015170 RepID=UPI0022DDC139|nr:M14 family metallopeptidase [Zunongwangia sp. HRR-M8]WBL23432.1 M14 family metallopeptidase [Zunongwangia sp. HRR-M8]